MKKSILVLSVMLLATSGAFAKPSGGYVLPKHNNPPRMVVKHHPPRPIEPSYHHRHHYMNYYSCNCHSPYCIHRSHWDTFFRVAPGISIRVSI